MTLPLYNTHSHTGSWQPNLSLPLHSKLDFLSSSLSLLFFSSPPFYSAGRSCLCQIQSLLPSRLLSLSLCPSLHLCLLPIISFPGFSCFLLLLSFSPPFLCASSSQYPSPLFICPPFSAHFTDLVSACSLFLLPCTATSHPLFSLCLSLSPFFLLQPLFSFTLGVRALWRLSAPSWTSSRRKS